MNERKGERYFDYCISYGEKSYLRISEGGYASVDFLEEKDDFPDVHGYYSLNPEEAKSIVDVAEAVFSHGKVVHESAWKQAEKNSDLPHFLAKAKTLGNLWTKNDQEGNGLLVQDDGSVLSAIEEANHALVNTSRSIPSKQAILVYNDDSAYSSALGDWKYYLLEDRQSARVVRHFQDELGNADQIDFEYTLPLEDGEKIGNALDVLSQKKNEASSLAR